MSERASAECHSAALDVLAETAQEVTEVRKDWRKFKLAILSALSITDPWAITTWQQVDYVKAIERLRPRAPSAAPPKSEAWECDRCDGCGWYEGGKYLNTTCEVCGGTGVVIRAAPASTQESHE